MIINHDKLLTVLSFTAMLFTCAGFYTLIFNVILAAIFFICGVSVLALFFILLFIFLKVKK